LDGSCDVSDLDEQPGCTGWADAIEVGQPRATGGQQAVEYFVRGVLAGVDHIGAGVFGRGGSRCSSRIGDAAVVS
jgi:hypothetical protein